MLVVTIDSLPGYEIIDVIGDVLGATAKPQNTFLAGVKQLPGSVTSPHAETLSGWRREAVAHMTTMAYKRGANAVVGMRFDHRAIGSSWTEICAYGTAVFVVPKRD